MIKKYINSYCNNKDIILEYKENGLKKQEIIKDFKWYLLIDLKNWKRLEKVSDRMIKAKLINSYEIVGDYIKLFTDNLNNRYQEDGRKKLIEFLNKHNVIHYEADINSDKRYCLDNDIEVAERNDYNILYFDIETDDTNNFINIGKDKILSIAGIDDKGNEYYLDDKDEKTLLKKTIELFDKYDILVSWNGEKFDKVYIMERLKFYNIRGFSFYNRAHIDLMQRFIEMFFSDPDIKSYSLEYISQHFLGKGKVKYEGKIIDLYNNNPEKLKEYNIQDVILLKELDEKVNCLNLIILRSKWCNTFLTRFYPSELLDNYILRVAHKDNIYCLSNRENVESSGYTGGYVLDPIKGLHENVFVLDFKSLYPSLIMTSNIGFDTIDENGKIINPGTEKQFLNDRESIIKTTIKELIGKRKEYKKKRVEMLKQGKEKTPEYEVVRANELTMKVIANSVYGIMGQSKSRYYSKDIAESITKFGQWCIKFTKLFFEKHGFIVIYGDTDSVFIKDNDKNQLDGDIEIFLEQFHYELEKTLKEKYNIEENYIELEFEKKFSKLIMVDKKNYTGRLTIEDGNKVDKLKTTGLDYIKKSSIKAGADLQKALIRKILYENYNVLNCEDFIEEWKENVLGMKLNKDVLIINIKLSKDPKEYNQNLPQIKVANEMLQEKGFLETNNIQYIVLDYTNKIFIQPKNFKGDYDTVYYWNHRIYNLLNRIVHTVYPNNNWDSYLEKKVNKKNKEYNQNKLF